MPIQTTIILMICLTSISSLPKNNYLENVQYKAGNYPNNFKAPKIYGGQEIKPHTLPYMAATLSGYSDGWHIQCGGTLFSRRHILSAAHCFSRDDSRLMNIQVTLGAHDISRKEDVQTIINVSPRGVSIHPFYSRTLIINDIAIITLPKSVNTNDIIYPINLPKSLTKSKSYVSREALVAGWGYLSEENVKRSYTLHAVNVTVVDHVICSPYVRDPITQICTMETDIHRAPCKGDSGGPLILDGEVIGIVSYGSICDWESPSIYTKVAAYLDWIKEVTQNKYINNLV